MYFYKNYYSYFNITEYINLFDITVLKTDTFISRYICCNCCNVFHIQLHIHIYIYTSYHGSTDPAQPSSTPTSWHKSTNQLPRAPGINQSRFVGFISQSLNSTC